MTFSTIQTLSEGVKPFSMPMPFDGLAGDDVSVANALAKRYQEAGIDPSAAYDDPETAMQDFQLGQAGF